MIEQILRKRGIEDVEAFLTPSLSRLPSPDKLPGIAEATDVILDAVVKGKKFVVFGDYDCDGVCATAIMLKVLGALKAKVEPFLPERLSEGYGMSSQSVARMLRENPDVSVLITVDNGVNSIDQVAELKSKGIAVVITDHHLPGDELPQADALVDPKVQSPKELDQLCGAAVAYLLANQMISKARSRGIYHGDGIGGPLLVLAGIATVTDIMPLLGVNRILVAEAIRHFRAWAPIGLKELYNRAVKSGHDALTSRDFGFLLGPRINAAGRLATGMEALDLIVSDDREIAREAARIVDLHNAERKSIEQKMSDEAMGKLVEGAFSQVIDLPDGHPGVAGIVAAKVLDKLGKCGPVCVIAGGHGSARSPEWLNVRDAFVACSEMLEVFGGHAAAGGFSVKPGRIDDFREALEAYCKGICRAEDKKSQNNDEPELWIDKTAVNLELAEEILQMEPFGECNEEPLFGIRAAEFIDIKQTGSDGKHLVLTLSGGMRAIWWGRGDLFYELRKCIDRPSDILFKIMISDYGERHVELRIVNLLPAGER